MKTIGVVVILLLALGMAWGPAPAIANDDAAIEQLQKSCQLMTNAELSEVRGKLREHLPPEVIKLARCFYSKLPPETQTAVRIIFRVILKYAAVQEQPNFK